MKIFSDDTVKDYSNTIGERNEVDEIMSMPLFYQAVLGQNLLDPKWTWKNRIVKQIFIALLNIYVIFGTKVFLEDANDVTSIGEAYYTLMIASFFPVKYLLFVNTRKPFRKSYLIAKTSLLDMMKKDSVEKSNEFLEKVKMGVKMLFTMVLFPVIMYLAAAIWNYIRGTRVTLSKTTSTLMPMTSPCYEVGLVLHTIYLFSMAFGFMAIDTWFVLLMFFFCVACDSLVNTLNVEPKGPDETDLKYARRLNDTLRTFYKNHETLMEYLNILSDMYRWPTVIPLLKVSLSFCLIMFLMTEQVEWTFLSNFLPTVVEIFAYNWFGEQIKLKGTQINMALLNFDWTSMSIKDKKSYLIIISYMTKEFSIQTAVGNDLSMLTLSSVCKLSYQAFAVLKSMET